jgi:glycosyltransferase involved in cell wall biosynthesis
MDSAPGVTVIITAYNYGQFLGDAVDSALAQTYPNIEILVIDDGSTDNTPHIAALYDSQIRYVRQANAGVCAARNVGLELATHDWVVFLDADDALYPWMVEVAMRAALNESEIPAAIMGAWVAWNVEAPSTIEQVCNTVPRISKVSVKQLLLRNTLAPTALLRKQVLQDLGGYDSLVGGAEDRDMWIRIAARFHFIALDQVFYRFRLVLTSLSHQPQKQQAATRRVLQKAKANPHIVQPFWVWRESKAIYLYQSAMTYSMAEHHSKAFFLAICSIFYWPWLSAGRTPPFPLLARMRFILSHLILIIRKYGRTSALSFFQCFD